MLRYRGSCEFFNGKLRMFESVVQMAGKPVAFDDDDPNKTTPTRRYI